MKNLLQTLIQSGLSEDQAIKTIEVTYQWTSDNYPLLAVISKSAILRPAGIVPERFSAQAGPNMSSNAPNIPLENDDSVRTGRQETRRR